MPFMGLMKQTAYRNRPCHLVTTLLLLAAIVLTASCGPQVIKGRPPFINLNGMNLQGEAITADFGVSNQNGLPMTIDSIDITVTVNETELIRHARSFRLKIDANSTEEVQIENLPDDFTRSLLASLDSGEIKSLPFDLRGRVLTVEDGYLRFEHTGYLYPVPGKPNHFRSAVTHARGLRREDPL